MAGWEYEKFGLSLFPRPGLTVYGAGFRLPSKVVAHFKSVTVTPHLWPLLLGEIKIADLALGSPTATITIPTTLPQDESPSDLNHKDILTNLAPLLASFAQKDLTIIVQNGSVTLDRGDLNSLRIKGAYLKGGASLRNGKIEILLKELHLESPQLTVSGKLSGDPERKRIRVSLEGKEIDVGSLRKQALALAGETGGVVDFFALLRGGTSLSSRSTPRVIPSRKRSL